MVRTFKFNGQTFTVANGTCNDADNVALFPVRMTVNNGGRWVAFGRFYGETPAQAAKAALVYMAGRTFDVDAAMVEADHEQHRRDQLAERAAEHRAREARREAERAEARATQPMLAVQVRTERAWNSETPFERPTSVDIYGRPHDLGQVTFDLSGGWTGVYEPLAVCSHGRSGMSPAEARVYAMALLRAADVAEEFNTKVLPTLNATERGAK